MTSKLTRERLEEIRDYDTCVTLEESAELARIALTAMDSEPVAVVDIQRGRGDGRKYALCYTSAGHSLPDDVYNLYVAPQPAPASEPITVTDDMAYAFHHALTDSMIGADDVEEIKTGLRAVFANLTAPIVSAKYPERLPCSVLLEPGLRFGKGIKTSTVLAALARREVYESDMAALSPEEKEGFREKIEDFKALMAQPAPVVQCPFPCGWDNLNKLAIQDAAFVTLALVAGEPATESIRQAAISNNDRLLKVIAACRAAMLQTQSVCTCPSGDGSLRWPCPSHPGNSPVIPDGWTGNDKANAALMMLDRIETVDPVDDDRIDGIKRIIHELAAAPQEVEGE